MQFFKYALAAFSIGSAIAAPAPAPQLPVVGEVTKLVDIQALVGVVADVKVTVEASLQVLANIDVNADVDVDVNIQSTVASIRKEVQTIESAVEPLLKATVSQLALVDLTIVLDLLNDVFAIVNGVEVTVEGLLQSLPNGKLLIPTVLFQQPLTPVTDVKKVVKQEVSYLLSTLQPVLKPVLGLVSGLVGTNTGAIVNEINGLVVKVDGLLSGLLQGLLGTVISIL